MIYGLGPVINQIFQDKKVSQLKNQKKYYQKLCSFQCNLSSIQHHLLKELIFCGLKFATSCGRKSLLAFGQTEIRFMLN
jgi:hypothetical protein